MSNTAKRVVIVGTGHAGGAAAALLRQYGWQGPVTLIGPEPMVPYQRPPLSKAWLKGEHELADLLLRPATFYPDNQIGLRLGCEVAAIDRVAGCVALSNGERVAYDHLIIATGCHARALPISGNQLEGVVALRTLADADRLRAQLRAGTRIAIVGAGYIGLEVAASARSLGAEVVVIEREARVLPRVASTPLSEFFRQRHTDAGVRIISGAAVEAFDGERQRVAAIRLSDGEEIACDAVLVAIGGAPNEALASAAGLECENGIRVDLAARPADPAIHAIGDCTHRPVPLYQRTCRLESVPNALEQAKQAAADLCGRPPPVPEVPWFWSDQYDLKLIIVGVAQEHDTVVVRGDPAARSFSACYLRGGELIAVDTINSAKDQLAARKLIAAHARPDVSKLANPAIPLKDC